MGPAYESASTDPDPDLLGRASIDPCPWPSRFPDSWQSSRAWRPGGRARSAASWREVPAITIEMRRGVSLDRAITRVLFGGPPQCPLARRRGQPREFLPGALAPGTVRPRTLRGAGGGGVGLGPPAAGRLQRLRLPRSRLWCIEAPAGEVVSAAGSVPVGPRGRCAISWLRGAPCWTTRIHPASSCLRREEPVPPVRHASLLPEEGASAPMFGPGCRV